MSVIYVKMIVLMVWYSTVFLLQYMCIKQIRF